MKTPDWITIASAFIAGLALVVSIIALWISSKQEKAMQKQFSFEIITSCTTRFQEILELIDSPDEKQKIRGYKKYIDLCNEELFYFQQGYIPNDIVKEWLDGMIVFIPHYDKNEKKGDNDKIQEKFISDNKLLENYPRIKNIFIVDKVYDINKPKERINLVEELLKNIKKR
ncbi:hypothetical protein ACP8Y2_00130 [Herpetosiphon llansteffanensis]